MNPEELAVVVDLFELGQVRDVVVGGTGWGGHNTVWRVDTVDGRWAVKEIRRAVPPTADRAAAIEAAAVAGGVPAPAPVVSRTGRYFETVGSDAGSFSVRVNLWADGGTRSNEQVTVAEARGFGALVSRLHQLQLPVVDVGEEFEVDELAACYDRLVAQGAARGLGWADMLRSRRPALQAALDVADVGPVDDEVGSHRDLNAHNVLVGDQLWLIDWDAAGPASPRFERACYSLLWGQVDGGGYDVERIDSFLRGYRDAGGDLREDDAALLGLWLRGLVGWTADNLRLSLEGHDPAQHDRAGLLVQALLAGPATVDERTEIYIDRVQRMNR